VLNQPSNYAGNWTIFPNCTLEIDGDNRLGNAANTLAIGDGGRLRVTGTFSSGRAIVCGIPGTIDVTTGNTLTLTSNPGAGSGQLDKDGGGVLVLGASSGQTGDTSVTAGTLRLQHA